MIFDLNEFAKEVHQNAIDHGFWDDDATDESQIALIHSEWSEALEEYRANRPMAWYECKEVEHSSPKMCAPKDEYDCLAYDQCDTCPHRGRKPEGVAVELIDGVLRVLDYCAAKGIQVEDCKWESTMGFFNLVVHLHNITSMLIHIPRMVSPKKQTYIVSAVFAFVRSYGIDPYELMREKHQYNLTRPHKHGKRY